MTGIREETSLLVEQRKRTIIAENEPETKEMLDRFNDKKIKEEKEEDTEEINTKSETQSCDIPVIFAENNSENQDIHGSNGANKLEVTPVEAVHAKIKEETEKEAAHAEIKEETENELETKSEIDPVKATHVENVHAKIKEETEKEAVHAEIKEETDNELETKSETFKHNIPVIFAEYNSGNQNIYESNGTNKSETAPVKAIPVGTEVAPVEAVHAEIKEETEKEAVHAKIKEETENELGTKSEIFRRDIHAIFAENNPENQTAPVEAIPVGTENNPTKNIYKTLENDPEESIKKENLLFTGLRYRTIVTTDEIETKEILTWYNKLKLMDKEDTTEVNKENEIFSCDIPVIFAENDSGKQCFYGSEGAHEVSLIKGNCPKTLKPWKNTYPDNYVPIPICWKFQILSSNSTEYDNFQLIRVNCNFKTNSYQHYEKHLKLIHKVFINEIEAKEIEDIDEDLEKIFSLYSINEQLELYEDDQNNNVFNNEEIFKNPKGIKNLINNLEKNSIEDQESKTTSEEESSDSESEDEDDEPIKEINEKRKLPEFTQNRSDHLNQEDYVEYIKSTYFKNNNNMPPLVESSDKDSDDEEDSDDEDSQNEESDKMPPLTDTDNSNDDSDSEDSGNDKSKQSLTKKEITNKKEENLEEEKLKKENSNEEEKIETENVNEDENIDDEEEKIETENFNKDKNIDDNKTKQNNLDGKEKSNIFHGVMHFIIISFIIFITKFKSTNGATATTAEDPNKTRRKPIKGDNCRNFFNNTSKIKKHKKYYAPIALNGSEAQSDPLKFNPKAERGKPLNSEVCNKSFGCISNMKKHNRNYTATALHHNSNSSNSTPTPPPNTGVEREKSFNHTSDIIKRETNNAITTKWADVASRGTTHLASKVTANRETTYPVVKVVANRGKTRLVMNVLQPVKGHRHALIADIIFNYLIIFKNPNNDQTLSDIALNARQNLATSDT